MTFPVFDIENRQQFEKMAMQVYQYQLEHSQVYNKYCSFLGKPRAQTIQEIPYLPISFFKTHKVTTGSFNNTKLQFTSSGTTGTNTSTHYVADPTIYQKSLDKSFKRYYGDPKDYIVLALLPHYLERTGSSLVYMVDRWVQQTQDDRSGFYLNNLKDLSSILKAVQQSGKKVILIGVTFALLQLAEQYPMELPNSIIIETGGMKGMRKEMIKAELHEVLSTAFAKAQIHSEYGMTELLSQAYAADGIHFQTPPWMQVSARDTNDPLSRIDHGKTGGLNVIDLANLESCAFIATQDLCKTHEDGRFEVLGRFDHSDIRGCNLMVIE